MLDSGTKVYTKIIDINEKVLARMPYAHNRKNTYGRFEGLVPGTKGRLWWILHSSGILSSYLKEEVFRCEN